MYNVSKQIYSSFIIIFLIVSISCNRPKPAYQTWEVYGGSPDNIHYSSLNEIDTSNVTQLQVAWTFHAGDLDSTNSQLQVNPIIVGNNMFVVSPKLKLICLNAGSGTKAWQFDPFNNGDTLIKNPSINACRGVTYYQSSDSDRRIFYTAGSLMYCINASNGLPIHSFGGKGFIDLHNDLGRDVSQLYVTSTTPGVIYHDLIIITTRVAEDANAAPGHIRAYDVHTGKLRWIFHTIPFPGEPGYETWDDPEAYKHIGGVNVWSGLTLDYNAGIVYAPLGSASYDFYGGKRLGQDLYANCILALDAQTGQRRWHFQTVHHDVWDRDLPSPPALVTVTKDGRMVMGVAQVTKSGFIFLLDRRSGKPLYPVEERTVPTNSDLEGERISSTQPFPTFFSPFVRQNLDTNNLNNLIPESSYNDLKNRLAKYKTGNLFTPPSKEGTVIFPGFDGGSEWGGPSFDPSLGYLYVNASEMPWVLTMVHNDDKNKKTVNTSYAAEGQSLYKNHCMSCHGAELQGSGNYPPLVNLQSKYTSSQIVNIINTGRRMMPAFHQLSNDEKKAITSFILNDKKEGARPYLKSNGSLDPYLDLPYTSTGYNKFLTKEGYPAVRPPWGSLTAIDLNTGKIAWKDTLGDYAELKAKGIHSGTENYGGSVVTAGGLLFIAATSDHKFRAFNKRNGKLLWEADLPASGFATPSVYKQNGKEFIVIACGGGKLGKKSGDSYVAFSLTNKK